MQAVSNRFVRVVSLIAILSLVLTRTGPVRAQDDELTGVDGNAYTSPTFGYTFEWDEEIWQVDEAFTDSGYDYINLNTESSDLYIEGLYFYRGDPDDCLEGERLAIAEDYEQDDLNPILDSEDLPYEESGDGYAYGMYELLESGDADAQVDSILYLECVTLVPDSAVMVITGFLDPNDFETQRGYMADLLDTLQLGDVTDRPENTDNVEQVMREASLDIDDYWTTQFEDMGESYVVPKFISFTGPTETECGDAVAGESGPFYCPSDQTVYLDVEEVYNNMLPIGVVVVQMVIAHEIGHHVQELLGLQGCTLTECGPQESSLAIELQADCFAGAWMQDAVSRGFIQKGDVKRIDTAMRDYLGDPPDVTEDDPDAHGSAELREQIFEAGFNDGLSSCGLEE